MKTVAVILVLTVALGVKGYNVGHTYSQYRDAGTRISSRYDRMAENQEDSVRLFTESAAHAAKRGDLQAAAALMQTATEAARQAARYRTAAKVRTAPWSLFEQALWGNQVRHHGQKLTPTTGFCQLEDSCEGGR